MIARRRRATPSRAPRLARIERITLISEEPYA
jgi:hypothetical protein